EGALLAVADDLDLQGNARLRDNSTTPNPSTNEETLLGRAVRLEKVVELGVVDSRERARGKRRQDVRVQLRARPRLVRPPLGEVDLGPAAARRVGARRELAIGGLTTSEPLRVSERNTERDRELVPLGRADLCRA